MSRNDELRRLANDWNDAWNSREASKLAAFFTESGTYYEPENPGEPRPGRAAIAQSAERTWSQWPNAKFSIVSTIVEAPHVAIEWRSSSTGDGARLEGVDLLSFDGDLIQSVRVYYDAHQRKAGAESAQ